MAFSNEEIAVEMVGRVEDYLAKLDEARAKTESAGKAIDGAIDETVSKVEQSMTKAGVATGQFASATSSTGQSIDKMGNANKSAQAKVEGLADKMERVGKTMRRVGQEAMDVGDSISRLTAGLDFKEALEGFAEAERGERLLRSALEANGRSVDELMDRYKEFADTIQEHSTVDDDYVVSLLQQAEALDVTGASAERAVRNALALAESFGLSADESIRATAALEKGDASLVSRKLGLKGIKDETEKVAEAQRLLLNMYKKVDDATETTSGHIAQVRNIWGNFKETLGETMAMVLGPVIKGLEYGIDVFKMIPKPITDVISITLLLVGGLGTLAVAVGTASIAFSAMGTTLGVFVTKAALASAGVLALKVALVGGLAYAGYEVARSLSGANQAIEELAQATEKSKQLNDVWATRFTEGTKDAIKVVDGLTNRMDQRTALASELEKAQKQLKGLTSGLESSGKELDDVNNRWNRLTATSAVDAAKHRQDEWNKKVELGRVRVDELSRALGKIKLPEEDPEILKAIEKFNKELDTQRKTLGMTSEQVKLYEISLMGANAEMLKASNRAIELNSALKEINTIQANMDQLTKSFKELQFTNKLDMRGVTDSEREFLKIVNNLNNTRIDVKAKIELSQDEVDKAVAEREKLSKHLDALNNQKPTDLPITKKDAEERIAAINKRLLELNAIMRDQDTIIAKVDKTLVGFNDEQLKQVNILERANKILDSAGEITKEYMTPLQKYQEQVNKINLLLETGAISQDTYNRALDDANKKLEDTEKAAKKAHDELKRLDGVKFNSVESRQRIDDFRDAMKEQFKERQRIDEMRRNRNVPSPRMTNKEKEIEEGAIEKVRQFQIQQQKIDQSKTPFNIPKPVNPVGTNNTNRPEVVVASAAENDIQKNTKESAKRLESIDNTLQAINRKPVTNIGVAEVQS